MFSIATPWYRTIGAYALYGCARLAAVGGFGLAVAAIGTGNALDWRSQLSPGVLDELLVISQHGEIAQLRRRLEELKGDPLVDALEAYAKTYRMERIRELPEVRLSKPHPAP